MKKQIAITAFLVFLAPAILQGCATNESPTAEEPAIENTETAANPNTTETSTEQTGTLQLVANGEDFIRQGFVTKDGWEMSFDHVYITLADVTAYQTDPPFDPEAGKEIEASQQVSLDQPQTVDLAAGDDNADPVLIKEIEAPAGRYNALSWQMVPASSGEAEGYPLVLDGTATKDGRTIDFVIKMSPELAFTCGDYVGEARKGILEPGGSADLEATFHFDHLFGDAEAPAEDEINTGALGFEPFAALAQDGQLDVESATLQERLPAADYSKLLGILPSLGHVGEGHCEETRLTTT